jgi:hypothetical protein
MVESGRPRRRPDKVADNLGRRRDDPARRGGDAEGALRSLIGSGKSRLPPSVAMRARDVARPTDADAAQAEAELVLRFSHPPPTRREGQS